MNRNLYRRIHPIAEADGLSPKKPRKQEDNVFQAAERRLAVLKFLYRICRSHKLLRKNEENFVQVQKNI